MHLSYVAKSLTGALFLSLASAPAMAGPVITWCAIPPNPNHVSCSSPGAVTFTDTYSNCTGTFNSGQCNVTYTITHTGDQPTWTTTGIGSGSGMTLDQCKNYGGMSCSIQDNSPPPPKATNCAFTEKTFLTPPSCSGSLTIGGNTSSYTFNVGSTNDCKTSLQSAVGSNVDLSSCSFTLGKPTPVTNCTVTYNEATQYCGGSFTQSNDSTPTGIGAFSVANLDACKAAVKNGYPGYDMSSCQYTDIPAPPAPPPTPAVPPSSNTCMGTFSPSGECKGVYKLSANPETPFDFTGLANINACLSKLNSERGVSSCNINPTLSSQTSPTTGTSTGSTTTTPAVTGSTGTPTGPSGVPANSNPSTGLTLSPAQQCTAYYVGGSNPSCNVVYAFNAVTNMFTQSHAFSGMASASACLASSQSYVQSTGRNEPCHSVDNTPAGAATSTSSSGTTSSASVTETSCTFTYNKSTTDCEGTAHYSNGTSATISSDHNVASIDICNTEARNTYSPNGVTCSNAVDISPATTSTGTSTSGSGNSGASSTGSNTGTTSSTSSNIVVTSCGVNENPNTGHCTAHWTTSAGGSTVMTDDIPNIATLQGCQTAMQAAHSFLGSVCSYTTTPLTAASNASTSSTSSTSSTGTTTSTSTASSVPSSCTISLNSTAGTCIGHYILAGVPYAINYTSTGTPGTLTANACNSYASLAHANMPTCTVTDDTPPVYIVQSCSYAYAPAPNTCNGTYIIGRTGTEHITRVRPQMIDNTRNKCENDLLTAWNDPIYGTITSTVSCTRQ